MQSGPSDLPWWSPHVMALYKWGKHLIPSKLDLNNLGKKHDHT